MYVFIYSLKSGPLLQYRCFTHTPHINDAVSIYNAYRNILYSQLRTYTVTVHRNGFSHRVKSHKIFSDLFLRKWDFRNTTCFTSIVYFASRTVTIMSSTVEVRFLKIDECAWHWFCCNWPHLFLCDHWQKLYKAAQAGVIVQVKALLLVATESDVNYQDQVR